MMGAQIISNRQEQLMTFFLDEDAFGINVMKIQEVTGKLPVKKVPLAPPFIKGLINLRGQIATAIDLRILFNTKNAKTSEAQASVVCKFNGNLIALLVDRLGDVVETHSDHEESPPMTLPHGVKKYLRAVSKTDAKLLKIIDLMKLSNELKLNNDQQ